MAANDEMISLNLSEKPIRETWVYDLHCPNCGSTNCREKGPSGDERGFFPLLNGEYNICDSCKTRFSDYGDVEPPNHEVKGILAILGLMVGTFAIVAIIGLILQFFGKV